MFETVKPKLESPVEAGRHHLRPTRPPKKNHIGFLWEGSIFRMGWCGGGLIVKGGGGWVCRVTLGWVRDALEPQKA